MRAQLRGTRFGRSNYSFLLITLFFVSANIVNSTILYGQIEENAPAGTLVTGLPFVDKCQDSNIPELKPTLTGKFSSDFTFEYLENTGFVLKTTKSFDGEFKSSYTVSARLSGCKNANENVTIIINIVAKNDSSLQLNLKHEMKDADTQGRKPRAVSEQLTYTVTVSESVKVGDLIFTVPEQRFEKKWFDVLSEGNSPVQMERESGRVYLAHRLVKTAEVMVKIHNMRGNTCSLLLHIPL